MERHELWAEAIRDIGILFFVFAPLETLLRKERGSLAYCWLNRLSRVAVHRERRQNGNRKMIYLPWIVFLLGMAYMIWQGTKAKKEYLRRKMDQEKLTRAN
jgi:hypothetical protein